MSASPIMALFREFEIKYRQAGDMSFDEEISSGLYDEFRSLEERIMALPATSAQDLATKIILETKYGDFLLAYPGEGGVYDEALAILTNFEHPDTKLIELGQQFEAAFAVENAARQIARINSEWTDWEAAFHRTEAIVSQIEKVPARTLEGFRIKARCIQWCYGDDPVELFDHKSGDARLAQQIVNDLLGLTQKTGETQP